MSMTSYVEEYNYFMQQARIRCDFRSDVVNSYYPEDLHLISKDGKDIRWLCDAFYHILEETVSEGWYFLHDTEAVYVNTVKGLKAELKYDIPKLEFAHDVTNYISVLKYLLESLRMKALPLSEISVKEHYGRQEFVVDNNDYDQLKQTTIILANNILNATNGNPSSFYTTETTNTTGNVSSISYPDTQFLWQIGLRTGYQEVPSSTYGGKGYGQLFNMEFNTNNYYWVQGYRKYSAKYSMNSPLLENTQQLLYTNGNRTFYGHSMDSSLDLSYPDNIFNGSETGGNLSESFLCKLELYYDRPLQLWNWGNRG